MFQIDLKSRKSIYEQVMDNLKELILTGVLEAEGRLPSVRELASLLTVNPNTVQKAYRELERQGYIYTSTGLGSFVAPPERRRKDEQKIREALERLRTDLKELIYLGTAQESIRETVEEVLERGTGK